MADRVRIPVLPEFEPIQSDDSPFVTEFYRNVPPEFGFDVLSADPVTHPRLSEQLPHLKEFASRYYADWEIAAPTFLRFRDSLLIALDMRRDTLEKVFAVYDDDIAKPVLGRTETVTYNNVRDAGERKTFDDPAFGPGLSPNPSERAENVTERTGSTVTELSDLGVRPNHETLNGFIDNDRTRERLFVDVFGDCFLSFEAWKI